jgi:O-methyltransferase
MARALLRNVVPVRVREWLRDRWFQARGAFLAEPFRSVMPYTMVALKRLIVLDRLVREIDSLGIPGDVVECGTCNGGSGAILARVACQSSHGRHVWLLDSFAGMPVPGEQDGPAAQEFAGLCRATPARVRKVLGKVGAPEAGVTIVPGWFENTVPDLPVSQIALLNIDADWYDSVRLVLDRLYDKVVPGGFVHLDDYGYWEGCRKAWDDFAAARGLSILLQPIDGEGVYFQKPANAGAT